MARSKQTARQSTGGKPPLKSLIDKGRAAAGNTATGEGRCRQAKGSKLH